MRFRASRADARRLAQMGPDELRAFLSKCGPRELLMLDSAFEMWSDEGQYPPTSEGWRVWLMMAGRGYGKTRAGAEWVHNLSMGVPRRIALVAASIDEARSVMVEGASGILSVARRDRVNVTWEPSLKQLRWPRGSIAKLYSGDHGDGLRGPEHQFAWCDELAKWGDVENALAAAVETVGANAPPASPAEGQCFVVGTAPTGAWVGQGKALAGFAAGGWRFVAAMAGMRALDKANGQTATYDGAAWVVGTVKGAKLELAGAQVVGARGAAVPNPAGGTVVDVEVRAAIVALLDRMRTHGLIAP